MASLTVIVAKTQCPLSLWDIRYRASLLALWILHLWRRTKKAEWAGQDDHLVHGKSPGDPEKYERIGSISSSEVFFFFLKKTDVADFFIMQTITIL